MDLHEQELALTLIQMNSAGSRDENLEKACALIDGAVAAAHPQLVVLPEFFNTPYVFQHRDYAQMDWAERDDGPTITAMRDRARTHGIHLVATLFEEEAAGLYYDTAILIGPDGGIAGKYRKVHPAAVKSLEKIYFRYGSRFPVFRVGDWRLGVIICYDTTFPESARCSTLNGAELIVAPYAAPPIAFWREMMVTRAAENGVYFAPCNKAGQEGDWSFGGRSMIVAPTGAVLSETGTEDGQLVSAVLRREAVFQARRARPNLRDRRPDLYAPICSPTEDIPRVP
jgi:N-carbamoylputrescine amidase